jgi:hypothetical protein
MTDFEGMKDLFNFIQMSNILWKHWFNSYGWNMAKCINNVFLQSTRTAMQNAWFITMSFDEVTIIDYQS